jgi:Domain of unknown function (DUF6894)
MPRYYFDYWDGQTVSSDNEGVECPDEQAACQAAAKVLLDLAKDNIESTSSCEFSVEVSDETKKPLCRVTLQFEIEHLTQDSTM